MYGSRFDRGSHGRETRGIMGWLLLIGLGIGLLWLGFWLDEEDGQPNRASLDPVSMDRPSLAETDAVPVPPEQATAAPAATSPNVNFVEAATDTPPPEIPAASSDAAGWADEVFQLINQVRAENGLAPYTRNEALELAAWLHGEDSAQREDLTHIGSDGSTPSTRVQRAGYEAVGVSEITVTGDSPQWAVDWWMNETPPDDPHRSALLSTTYTDIGVAVVPVGQTHYFIAVLAQPK
jgi:uncharacterized protein YkwD